ncbi:MAG: ferritin [Holosporaceae bacterium]|nr:ferritin [Holosporaceae bacterium]
MGVAFGKRVGDALNKQVTEELSSAYLYLAMSNVLRDMGLEGCAGWVMQRSKEELDHAMKILMHIQERSTKIKLQPIAAPKQEWRAPLHIFEEMFRNEQRITSLVMSIYEYSIVEKDYQTQCFISWFVQKQVEKESAATSILDRLKKMQSTDIGVIMFDKELSQRK